jgi:hypothetical protein
MQSLKIKAWNGQRAIRIAANLLIGVMFFILGGYFGQWAFTVNAKRVLEDIFYSGMLRAVPAYAVGPYGLSWHVAFFVGCGGSTCVDDIPFEYVLSSDILLLAVSVLEVVWFVYLVWRSVKT